VQIGQESHVQGTDAIIHKGYRGPARATMLGLLLLAVGAAVSLAAALFLSRGGPVGFATFAYNLAVPLLTDRSRVTDRHSGLVLVILLSGSVVAAVGWFLLVVGSVWSVLRFQPRRRVVVSWRRIRPGTAVVAMDGASSGALTTGASSGEILPGPSQLGSLTVGDPLDVESS
jgi:hypothetical protein